MREYKFRVWIERTTDESAAKVVVDCLNWKLQVEKSKMDEAVKNGHDIYECEIIDCPICKYVYDNGNYSWFYIVKKLQLNNTSLEGYNE